ncbi:hypothetical protein INT44_003868 [Umbelopsis vinacea]|uniref:DUF7082 domain-containing protein n=1 Tax=Umbelopsis vinacea TaxID=44442 RepID=A0A8H7Q971_9FUNG|nr:hypothetical protein INT44_003868 [Umbelopsis vinacea]
MEDNAPIIRLASGFEPRPKNGDVLTSDNNKNPMGSVVQCSSLVGSDGTEITVIVQSALTDANFKIAFGSFIVETKQMSTMNLHTLVAAAPNHVLTQCNTYSVPVSVCAYRGNAAITTWPVGKFNYVSNDKRRRSSSFNYGNNREIQDNINKRNSTGSLPKVDVYTNPSYPQMYQNMGNPSYQSEQMPTLYQPYTPVSDAKISQRSGILDFSLRPNDQTQTGQTMNYEQFNQSPMDLMNQGNNDLSNVTLSGINDMSIFGSNSDIYQQQQQQNGYPYRTAPSKPRSPVYNTEKINLDIGGDLNTMAHGWTQEEWTNRRRLVQFWRTQDGSHITCGFQPVSQNSRLQGSIVVSCIFWEQKNECYITSVDCIYLLESLIGVRFSIEEKNRIRRNLEGFRPATVSKSKPDSVEYFKLIMGFPNPKPRNIEKDVKVFKWKVLPYALKKIVAKYTSTAHSLDRRSRSPISHGRSSSDQNMSNQRTPSPLLRPTGGQSMTSPYLTPTYGQQDMRRLSSESAMLDQNALSPQSIQNWSRSPSPMNMPLPNNQTLSPTNLEFPAQSFQTYQS